MDDAVRGRHPLNIARAEIAAVAEAVLVPHVPVEHVRDGFESAMRVRRKARDVIVGIVRIELVEHQERVDTQIARAAQAASQLHARAVGCGY